LFCADQEWKINRQRQRPFHSGQRYGFQQLELEDKSSGQKINALNLHLESLWRTISSLPNIKRFGTMSEIVRSNQDPKLLLQALEENAKNQRAEIDELLGVLNQLQDPILLAGDFNSPPSLWFHRYLRKEYQDAHIKTGNGFGHTTSRLDFLQMRVDYLYASEELSWTGNSSVNYQTHCSDHFPLQSFFSWGD
jgi:endonuclease/exonuclease/phosphatase family metal-dependent hydrolase